MRENKSDQVFREKVVSEAGERLIRSARQALAHARGEENEETGCLVIPADSTKEERLRLIEDWMGSDDEEDAAEDAPANIHRSLPASPATRNPAAQRRVAASGKSR